MRARGEPPGAPAEYSFGDYLVRSDDLLLRYRGARAPLPPRAVLTLLALLERAGDVVSKEALLDAVWGDAAVEEANLSQNVYLLRRFFQSTSGTALIETLPKRGYRFTAPVVRRPGDAGGSANRAPYSATRRGAAAAALAAAVLLAASGTVLSASGYRASGLGAAPRAEGAVAERADALGWYYVRSSSEKALRAGLEQFRRVAALEPGDPEGYAGEAVAYAKLADLEEGAPSGVTDAVNAQRLAARAVAVDASSPIAFAARGFVEYDLLSENERARGDLAKAVAGDPNFGPSRKWYGAVLLWSGDLAGGRAQLMRAQALDPGLPALDYLLALCAYMSRRYDEAASFAVLALDDPLSGDANRLLMAAAYDEAHRYGAAIAALHGVSDSPSDALAKNGALAHIYASMGADARARQAVAVVRRLSNWEIQRPVLAAIAYASVGDSDDAFASLSQLSASDRRLFAMDPRLDALRKDRRFASWLRG